MGLPNIQLRVGELPFIIKYVCGEDILAPYPAEKEIWINGILMARIYNTKDIPEEDVLKWLK